MTRTSHDEVLDGADRDALGCCDRWFEECHEESPLQGRAEREGEQTDAEGHPDIRGVQHEEVAEEIILQFDLTSDIAWQVIEEDETGGEGDGEDDAEGSSLIEA
jgi:hypothetical protein